VSALEPASAAETVLVPFTASSVALVRRSLDRTLVQSGVPDDARDDALLVLSELVSNAVKHASPLGDRGIKVHWALEPDRLEIAVTDGGSHTDPVADMAVMTAVGGRGLDIVRQLSVGWGVREDGGHVTVWATLPSAVVRPAGTDPGPTAPGTGH
jgi:anti-sigma regulatory factor (Ser/Thr protein kinase)